MNSKRIRRATSVLILLLLILASGCALRGPKLEGIAKGDHSFARQDYIQAIQDYQIFLTEAVSSAEVQQAQFRLAKSFFLSGDYALAAVEFDIYQREYPRSDSLATAAWYEALCWVRQSPPYDRDASLTEKAIHKLTKFQLDFPTSVHIEEARLETAALRDKLAHKDLAIARLYRGRHRLTAALIYYEKLLDEHSGSAWARMGAVEMIEVHLSRQEQTEADRIGDWLAAEAPDSDESGAAARLLGREP